MKRKLRMFKEEKRKEKVALLAAELLEKTEGKINIQHLKQAVRKLDVWKDYQIRTCNTAKSFNEYCQLNNISHEHSWAGEDGCRETAEILYGPNIIFGECIDKWYSDNGNITYSENKQSDAEFDINSIHIIFIKNNSWNQWDGQHNYDDYEYKLICYLPKDHPYKLNIKAQEFIKMFGDI